MSKSVSCKDCGCLALRHSKTLELSGASEDYRQSGTLPAENNRYLYDEIPVCVANAFNFAVLAPNKDHSYAVIRGSLHCEQFIAWQPALSPKEHIEMKQLQEQREHNRQMLESDRLWREAQAQAEREWKEQDRRDRAAEAAKVEKRYQDDREAANWRFWLGFAGAIVVTVIGQLLLRMILPAPTSPPPVVNVSIPAANAPAVQPPSR